MASNSQLSKKHPLSRVNCEYLISIFKSAHVYDLIEHSALLYSSQTRGRQCPVVSPHVSTRTFLAVLQRMRYGTGKANGASENVVDGDGAMKVLSLVLE